MLDTELSQRRRPIEALLWLGGAVACVWAFFQAAAMHGGYELPCVGVGGIPQNELMFDQWYLVWGSAATVLLAIALVRSFAADGLYACVRWISVRPRAALSVAAALVFIVAVAIRFGVLGEQPVTDDEMTYDFIMRTLLRLSKRLPLYSPPLSSICKKMA